MNIAIVDDMPDEIKDVTDFLEEYAAINQIEIEINKFSCAESFLNKYRSLLFTVIFMDIYMDGMTGIETAGLIREIDSSVTLIFLTNSEEHRPDAFYFHAYDYLTKPVKKESLFHTMDDLLRIRTAADNKNFIFSSNRHKYSLSYSEIIYIRTESNGSNYLEILGKSGSTYRTRMTFSSVSQQLLKDSRFILLESGVLVNLEHIALLKKDCAVLDNGKQISFSGRKAKEIQQVWQNYMFANIRNKSCRR